MVGAFWQKLLLQEAKLWTWMQMKQEVFDLADISSLDGCAMWGVTSCNIHKQLLKSSGPFQIPVTTFATSTQLPRFPEPSFHALTQLLSTSDP